VQGEDPTLREGLAAARAARGRILVWGTVAATVGVLVEQVERHSSPAGGMLARISEFGWALATFSVVPVLVFEDRPIRETLTRSGQLFRDTWGEAGVASAGGGLLAALVGALGVVAFIGLPSVAGSLALYVVALAVAAAALGGVVRGALYLYATEGAAALPGVDPDAVLRP